MSRVLAILLLVLALLGGTAVVVADGEDNNGQNCPEDNPTNAYVSASETAFEKSSEGRQEALESGECIP